MSIDYTEYIKGRAEYAPRINSSRLFTERGGLDPGVFYPVVPARDDEDVFPVDLVMQLPHEVVKVCETPGEEPEEKMLYVEGDWAYEVKAENGEAG